ncbi:unnamed protein product [Adineta ricciae]|uniref:Uncharacterized protein n=1 Tax=Adineta ricciae TaxID=249248 RepID=A0A815WAA6_ADIRI|nr:unnamed protein product [Adineta ricciae]
MTINSEITTKILFIHISRHIERWRYTFIQRSFHNNWHLICLPSQCKLILNKIGYVSLNRTFHTTRMAIS